MLLCLLEVVDCLCSEKEGRDNTHRKKEQLKPTTQITETNTQMKQVIKVRVERL